MNMIEKVARAISASTWGEGNPSSAMVEADWPNWTDEARAAIEALRDA